MAGRNEVSVVIRARDLASSVVSKFERGLRAVTRTAKQVATGVAAMGAAFASAVVAVGRLAQRGGQVLGVQNAFNRTFEGGADALAMMRRETRGLISDYELMKSANQAVALGAVRTAEEFARMARIAQDLGRAQGLTGDLTERFTVALGRQSIQRLDDFGITLNQTEANQRYAASLNKSVDALTETEKRQAFANEALRKGEELVRQMGESNLQAADQVNRGVTALKNFRDELSQMIATSPAVNDFFEGIANVGTDIVDALNGDAETIRAAFAAVGGIAGNAFSAAFLGAYAAALDKIDRALLPDFLEKRLMGPLGLGSQVFGGIAEEARGNIDAYLEALAAAGRAGQSRAAARGLGSGGAGGGGGGGGIGAGGAGGRAAGFSMQDFLVSMGIDPLRAGAMARNIHRGGPGFDRELLVGPPTALAGVTAQARPGGRTVTDVAGEFDEAAQLAVSSLGAMAQAAVEGSELTASSVTGMITRIVQSLPGVGGLAGSIIGAVGGIVGGLFGRGSSREPVAVRIDDYSSRALQKMRQQARDSFRGVTIIETGGNEVSRVEYELADRRRRNAVPDYVPRGG